MRGQRALASVVEKLLVVAIVGYAVAILWALVMHVFRLMDYTPFKELYLLVPWFPELFGANPSVPSSLSVPVLVHGYPGPPIGAIAPGTAEINGPWTADVAFHGFTPTQVVLWATLPALMGVLTVSVLALLQRIVHSVHRNEAFQRVNARRVTLIGLLILAITPAVFFGQLARIELVERSNVGQFTDPTYDLPWWPVAIGLTVIVIGEAFRAGSRMREELEAVV
jgi:Protein of unknown function (DUF2975)